MVIPAATNSPPPIVQIIEGEEDKVKRQKDIWTFERIMNSNDPDWQLVATGE